MGAAAVLIAGVCSLSGIAGALQRGDPDWDRRAAYLYTHAHTAWRDFRPKSYIVAGALEMARRGMKGVQPYPGAPKKFGGRHWYFQPFYLAKDEAIALLRKIVDSRTKSRDGRWSVGFGPNWGGDGWTGQAGVHHVGLGLAYVCAKYAPLLPEDLSAKLQDTVGNLYWFGDRGIYAGGGVGWGSYSNIPLSGACGMLLAADYANPALKAEAQERFDRMFRELRDYGYFEVMSSYTSFQLMSWAAVHELARDEDNRRKARLAMDGLLTILAHLYQPGFNVAGPFDREYSSAVSGAPSAHELFLMFGDPRGSLVGWYPLGIIAASDYRPPALLRDIAMRKTEAYAFGGTLWCSACASEGGFPTHALYKGPRRDGGRWVPFHCYMTRGGRIALAGAAGHIWSSRTGSKNLRISFAGGSRPVALTQQQALFSAQDHFMSVTPHFLNEAPNFKRLFRDNCVLSVWDPKQTSHGRLRGRPFTVTFVPIEGVEKTEREGAWFFMKQGDSYAAYAVLAEPQEQVAVEQRDIFGKGSKACPGKFYFVKTPEGSACAGVGEVADADDYPGGFEAFKRDILSRRIEFDAETKTVAYVARDKKRLAVTYDPEGYRIGERTFGREGLAPKYRLKSPWVEQKADEREVRLTRKGKTVVWDWERLSIRSR